MSILDIASVLDFLPKTYISSLAINIYLLIKFTMCIYKNLIYTRVKAFNGFFLEE